MIMKARYSFKWSKPEEISTPVKVEYEYITQIEPISYNEDKTLKEFKEKTLFVEKKSLWKDYIKSFDLGSISDQVINHITRGTPLVTSHTLPPGDYTNEHLLKSAEVVREMQSKGITLDMLEKYLSTLGTKKVEGEANAQ